MKKNKRIVPIIAALTAVLLVACGPSDEKLAEAEQARSLLLQAQQTAEDTYLDISDTALRAKLDELAEKSTEYEQVDFTKLNDTKIDEILPGITELTESYQNVGKELSDTLSKETEVKEEKAKHVGLDTYFINRTGMNLSKIVLHDVTADTFSDNLLGDDVVLMAGYTLMGTSLDVYADSREWEFVITDDVDTEYTLSCESLKGLELKGASIVLTYDPKEGVGEAEIGGYFPEPVKEEAIEAPGETTENGESSESSGAASEASSN